MSKRKVRLISLIVISGILLVVYLCILHGYHTFVCLDILVDDKGVESVRLVEQKHPLGMKATLLGDDYTTLDIQWQTDMGESGKYLFLPGYIDLSKVYVNISGEAFEGRTIALDGVGVEAGDMYCPGALEEGIHEVSVGEACWEFDVMQGSRIPSLWIETDEGMDYIHENKENTTAGVMQLLSETGETQYFGSIDTLKGRGNSSWSMMKKSYGLTLTNQASLLGMPNGRSWVLSGGGDPTGLRNKILYDTAVECGLKNAIQCELVDLYIDGSYYGCYLLTEKVDVGFGRLEIGNLEKNTELMNEEPLETYPYYVLPEAGGLVCGYSYPKQPADMSGGYLLEIEEYGQRFNAELSRFTTLRDHYVVVKEPSHASLEQVRTIQAFVQEFEDALYAIDGYNELGKSYLEYIDLESFVKRYLVDELSKNIDVGYTSYFFYKPQNEDRLYGGPVWDYDTALGNNMSWGDPAILKNPEGMYANSANWGTLFWEKAEFQAAAKEIFQAEMLPYLVKYMEEDLDEEIQSIKASMEMEQAYFGRTDLEEATEQLKDFLQKRTDFLAEELQ